MNIKTLMADSFNKKERAKKKAKKKKEKAERRAQRKEEGKKEVEFMYVDKDGNFTSEKPILHDDDEIELEDIEIAIPKKEDIEEDPIKKGTVKFFDNEKGYGFIDGHDSNQSYFVHVNSLSISITDGDKVTFEVEMGKKGPVAVNVKMAD